MIWNNRSSNKDFFEKHTQRMRVFGRFHAAAHDDSQPGREQAVLPDSAQAWLVGQTITATGGSRLVTGPADWSALMLMWRMTARRFSRS